MERLPLRFLPVRLKGVPGCNARGQSMVEFVVVLTALFLIAGLGRGYIGQLKDTIQQKYRSYCFGVAISDPPQGSYTMISASEDAGKTMKVAEKIGRMSSVEDSSSPKVLPMEQESATGAIRDFVGQAENF